MDFSYHTSNLPKPDINTQFDNPIVDLFHLRFDNLALA